MRLAFRPTLKQIFAISLLGLMAALGLLYYIFFEGSQQTILESAERFRHAAANEAADRIAGSLDSAPRAVEQFERQMRFGLTDPRNLNSVESGLLSLLLSDRTISEASFTFARADGYDGSGNLRVVTPTVGEASVFRSTGSGALTSMRTWWERGKFVAESHPLPSAGQKPSTAVVPDPTSHLTFQVPARRAVGGQLLWTDLHWSQLDDNLPEMQRRVEVSVQKAVNDAHGEFAGVLRLGLLKDQIDQSIDLKFSGFGDKDEHTVFLCDNLGRLIAGPGVNRVVVSGDDLRVATGNQPKAVVAALHQTLLKNIAQDHPDGTNSFLLDGERYLVTYRWLPGTQDWIVGIVVPRSFYLRGLTRTRNLVLAATLGLIAVILMVGAYVLRRIHRANSLLVRETARMKQFEFSPTSERSRLRDVNDVMEALERAKTAMRAMGKYVPLDLVRRLYHEGTEPMLGGENVELSILFTDVQDFTSCAERMEPHRLAEVLGLYLETLTREIQKERGTIDKYIGDAVMAFWNAPEPVLYHPRFACRAALNCIRALEDLFLSEAWGAMPRFETRFGLHCDIVSVGHFGAPERFNYTAIGDGVNLASRLEGLNKQYGTKILASEMLYRAACDRFAFRRIDRVSVKGKSRGVDVFELLGEKDGFQPAARFENYERGLRAYAEGDFASALESFRRSPDDPPSVAMAERCLEFLRDPPPKGWDGTFVLQSK